jgi:hypothetical protein
MPRLVVRQLLLAIRVLRPFDQLLQRWLSIRVRHLWDLVVCNELWNWKCKHWHCQFRAVNRRFLWWCGEDELLGEWVWGLL